MQSAALAALLGHHRYSVGDERALSQAVELVLQRGGVGYRREVSLGDAGVIDFLVEGHIGLELKAAGSPAAVIRQLHRYAGAAELDALVLLTTRASHRRLPATVQGKPLSVVHLLASAF